MAVDLEEYTKVLSPLAQATGIATAHRQFPLGQRERHLTEKELAVIVAVAVEGVIQAAGQIQALANVAPASGRPS